MSSPNRKAHSASPRKALRSCDVEEFSSECEEEGSQSGTEADLSEWSHNLCFHFVILAVVGAVEN